MDGFAVDAGENEEAAGREGNGGSRKGSHVRAKHRRCKSATDRNLDRGAVSPSVKNDFNESSELPPSRRTCRARSPLHEYSINTDNDTTSIHRTSLEKDIEKLQLRLQEEKSMRTMLERAMGRASSTLSPGHRHFAAQTRELIEEIELLEEEVANREQHVLSLYRSIFEQCVSRPPSEQSSVMASPAHVKNEPRKHPSIISSTFCSSKNFPLRPFQALASINDSGKRNLPLQSKTRHALLLSGKTNIQVEKVRPNHVKELRPTVGKTSMLRTLKDHLYQCPSQLSEEMVRCMASVYCWFCSSGSTNSEQNQAPFLLRSSTKIVIPQCGINEDRDRTCKSMVEVLSISADKNFPHASYALNNYRVLVEQLERVSVTQMETNAKIAFWINTYNSLIMHAYLAYGIPHSSLRRLALFHKAAYNISGQIVSANAIEQSIFCFHTPRVGRWLEIVLSTAMRKRSAEERQRIKSKFSIQTSPSLACFALCTGAFSDPVLKVYTASNVKEELEAAKREFLQANIIVKKSKKVFLPKVLERFAKEASLRSDDLINWVTENVDKKLSDSIQKCVDRKTSRKPSQVIEWLPYNPRFRYVFSKDLMEKQWRL
ncbi:uncharacterized protein LOC127786923 isoform X2 [Diospyros lotus]|uniref:uncharacterized protein LOC127786923 isoform X2 n=1 Tax=Diospyros lotus TaxID=55363 RepID=UPI00225BBD32|nr:uncharacterized protein LOC127786923 isoform X2 [Diospyros lotus]